MTKEARVWFITGASSGFGRALAHAVLNRGDMAVLAARRQERLADIEKAHHNSALALTLDVTDREQRKAACEAALKRFGRVDVLANIAGRGSLGAAEEFSSDQLREQMEVNFFGAVELTRELLPTMRAQASGHVLMLTSVGGLVSIGGFGTYCASKFALEGWSEALRDEVAPLGIRLTIVEPGAFRTEFAGAKNMRPAKQLPAYRAVVEPVERYLYEMHGAQPGDPARAADLMVATVDSPTPPLRLMLGADAFELWERKLAKTQAEFAAWKAVSETTAFADALVPRIGG